MKCRRSCQDCEEGGLNTQREAQMTSPSLLTIPTGLWTSTSRQQTSLWTEEQEEFYLKRIWKIGMRSWRIMRNASSLMHSLSSQLLIELSMRTLLRGSCRMFRYLRPSQVCTSATRGPWALYLNDVVIYFVFLTEFCQDLCKFYFSFASVQCYIYFRTNGIFQKWTGNLAVICWEISSVQLSAKLNIPDVYSVFQFEVNHNRLGVNSFSTNAPVSVHPLKALLARSASTK